MSETDAAERRQALAQALIRVAGGDQAALKIVYDATSAKLMGVILRILPDRGEAEDVLQEVYLTVWRKAALFEAAKASPITWLAALARNRAIDRVRAQASRPRTGDEAVPESVDPAPLADDGLALSQEARALEHCLDELEPTHAWAVRSAFFAGLTYSELAERAGAPLGTMKGWMRRSLQRLRGCLETTYADA